MLWNFVAGFATSILDIVVISISWNVTIMEETINIGESGVLMPRHPKSNRFAVSNSSGLKAPSKRIPQARDLAKHS